MVKLGLIAGGGSLPLEIAEYCRRAGRAVFVIRLRGFAEPALAAYDGVEVGLAELGKCIKALRRAACQTVCLAGIVSRPDFAQLAPDLRGLAALPGAIAAGRRGDDALLRFLVGEFEREGFGVQGADEGTFQERLEDTASTYAASPQVMEIIDFIRADASRPLCLPEREV